MADWITINPTSGVNNYNLSVSVDNNQTLSARTTYIKVYNELYGLADYCKVLQNNVLFELDKESISFETGDIGSVLTDTVTVEANANWDVSAPSWITLSQTSGSSGTTSIVVSVDGNTGDERTGIITFTCNGVEKTVAVTQEASTPLLIYTTNDGVGILGGTLYDGKWYLNITSVIEAHRFENQTTLTSIELRGVTGINAYAFSGCTNISTITFYEGLLYIGNCSFSGVRHITTPLLIPSTLTGTTSGKWFENTLIDYVIIKGRMEYHSEWYTWSIDGYPYFTGTTSVFGRDVTATTIDVYPSATLCDYAFAVHPSRVIIRSGVTTNPPEHIYEYHYIRKLSPSLTFEGYELWASETGQILIENNMSLDDYAIFKPNNDWTIDYL